MGVGAIVTEPGGEGRGLLHGPGAQADLGAEPPRPAEFRHALGKVDEDAAHDRQIDRLAAPREEMMKPSLMPLCSSSHSFLSSIIPFLGNITPLS